MRSEQGSPKLMCPSAKWKGNFSVTIKLCRGTEYIIEQWSQVLYRFLVLVSCGHSATEEEDGEEEKE